MSDTCCVTICSNAKGIDAFTNEWGSPDFIDECNDGVRSVEFSEINRGGNTELILLSKKGIVFYGDHGAGGDYGPMLFSSVEGRLYEVDSIGGEPTVRVKPDGTINPDDISAVEE